MVTKIPITGNGGMDSGNILTHIPTLPTRLPTTNSSSNKSFTATKEGGTNKKTDKVENILLSFRVSMLISSCTNICKSPTKLNRAGQKNITDLRNNTIVMRKIANRLKTVNDSKK